MTIAACCVSPEGVVFGADSAVTFSGSNHFFHGQKLYEIGKPGESSVGLAMWGLGCFPEVSYRTLIGRFSDDVEADPTRSIQDLAIDFGNAFWSSYRSAWAPQIDRLDELRKLVLRDEQQQAEYVYLSQSLSGGFCIGGCVKPDRIPKAYSLTYSLADYSLPAPEEIAVGEPRFWGQPNMLDRLSWGIDPKTFAAILDAKDGNGNKRWTGTPDDLVELVIANKLGRPSQHLPVREAVDWIYSSLYTTIKAMKFANFPPVCGGPIEIALITADRNFRWVRHKGLDTALGRHPFTE